MNDLQTEEFKKILENIPLMGGKLALKKDVVDQINLLLNKLDPEDRKKMQDRLMHMIEILNKNSEDLENLKQKQKNLFTNV